MRVLFGGLASLRTTVGLLVVSMVLVFAATLDQTHLGIWEIQEKYFRSIVVQWGIPGTGVSVPVFPGGYFIGGLLLANLACSYVIRWDTSWRRLGLNLVHAGVVVLLLGELFTGILRRESTLRLEVGETRGYSESVRSFELAIIGLSDRPGDREVVLNGARFSQKGAISAPELPFAVSVVEYHSNAAIEASGSPGLADRGLGARMRLVPMAPSSGGEESDFPGAYVRISAAGKYLGTWLVSPFLPDSQTFSVAGREWKILLRPERTYLPVTLTLQGIKNDLYPGTDIPRNFVSRVRVSGPKAKEYRDVAIAMNEPLRIGQFTFYQYQMNLAGKSSVFEVVKNPGWSVPYFACLMMGVGMTAHFFLCLLFSAPRPAGGGRTAPNGSLRTSTRRELLAPCIAVCLAGGFVAFSLWPRSVHPGADVGALGRLAVLDGGRVKPLDSVARSTLLKIQGRQDVRLPETGEYLVADPDAWIADVLFDPDRADTYPTFIVDSKELREVLGMGDAETRISYPDGLKRAFAVVGFGPSRRSRFSFAQLKPRLGELERQARNADAVSPDSRSPYQRKLVEMRNAIEIYLRLRSSAQPPDLPDFYSSLLEFASGMEVSSHPREAEVPAGAVASLKAMSDRFSYMEQMGNLRLIAPSAGVPSGWRSVGAALAEGLTNHRVDADALEFARIGHAWRARDTGAFDLSVEAFGRRQRERSRGLTEKVRFESWFNHAEPFYAGMLLYSSAFLLGVLSWLRSPKALGKSSFWVLTLAWVVTTLGIAARMWIEGRPPVTNLYSSALFVGWGAVSLCLVLEARFKNAVGSVAASMIGFATLLIAHHLSLSGDTMEMMRAVLDSNFWLATHVVVVTLGYAATFLAGFLALIYIGRGLLSRSLDAKTADELSRMVYGVICFSTLFSLVGTVLGGIWADQSWGRFWGWDPKENGALLIVLWNTVILHARSAGLIESRGLMVMAVLGNIVTGWSWFGVNMLGIGLHSYGFMEAAFYWLIAFGLSQLAIACLALQPLERWRSFSARTKP